MDPDYSRNTLKLAHIFVRFHSDDRSRLTKDNILGNLMNRYIVNQPEKKNPERKFGRRFGREDEDCLKLERYS